MMKKRKRGLEKAGHLGMHPPSLLFRPSCLAAAVLAVPAGYLIT